MLKIHAAEVSGVSFLTWSKWFVLPWSPVTGSIQACADRWMELKAGSQDRSVQSSLFFPVIFVDAAPFWFKSLQIYSLAKFSAPGNFLTKFARNSCSKNLIFQFLKKHFYSSHYYGIMWKMYKIYQCYIWFWQVELIWYSKCSEGHE